MARLIRTEKEVEGRYEEVWLVVEEDALEQWPAGPARSSAGRPPRVDGLERARGEAVYTADLQLPGMLHAAVLRSPHPHARVARIDLAPALALPGVHAAIGPGDIPQLTDECGYQGAAVAAVCADTLAQARAARRGDRRRVGGARAAARPGRGGRAASCCSASRGYSERGDFERGLAEADVVVEGEYRTQVVLHNSMETHQSVVQWVGDTLEVYISTQYIWGIRDEVASALGLPADKVRVSAITWAAASARRTAPDDYTFIAIELAKRTRPARALRADPPRGEHRRRQPQRDDPAADDRRKSDGTVTALGGEYVNAVGWSGWIVTDRGADADALRVSERADDELGARSSTCRR